jgi:hypothetical protein
VTVSFTFTLKVPYPVFEKFGVGLDCVDEGIDIGDADRSVNSHKKPIAGFTDGFSAGVNVNGIFPHCGVFGRIVKLEFGGGYDATVNAGDATEAHPVPVTVTV